MKNKHRYSITAKAMVAFEKTGLPITEFPKWLDSEYLLVIPGWLYIGTEYIGPVVGESSYVVVGISLGDEYTVRVKKNDGHDGAVTPLDLEEFIASFCLNGGRTLVTAVPEWLTVGMRYWPTPHREHPHVVTRIDTAGPGMVYIRPADQKDSPETGMPLSTFISSFFSKIQPRTRVPDLPTWVEKGARFFVDGVASGILVVAEVDWKSERVSVESERSSTVNAQIKFMEFNDSESKCIPLQLPDWVQIGVRFANTKEPKKTYQLECFMGRQIRAVSGELFPIAGFENGHYVKAADLPDWVKRGSRYYITDIESPAFIIESVDLQKNTVFSFKENGIGDDLVPQPVSLDNFIGPEATCLLLEVPDWVQVGAHFLSPDSCFTKTVKWFKKNTVQTTVRPYCFSDFANGMIQTSAPILPQAIKWPAWVKPGIPLRFVSDSGELDDTTYTVLGTSVGKIISESPMRDSFEISYKSVVNRVVIESPYPAWVKKGAKYMYSDPKWTEPRGPYTITKVRYDGVIGVRADDDGRNDEVYTPPKRFNECVVSEYIPVPNVYLNQVTHELIVVSDRPYWIKNTVSDVGVKDQMMIPLVPKM